jgi:protein-tyrosine-phosphatase
MLDRLGDVDLAPHSAKALTRDLIRHSGLLLAMAGNHKNWILEEAPRASRKVFTLRELASIIERVDPAAAPMPKWLEAVAAAAAPEAAIVTPGSPTDTQGRTGGQWHREPEARHRPPKSDAAGSAAPAPKLERPARLAHRMAEAVETLADLRSQFPAPTAGGGFDVTDPFRRPPEVYARMESELVPAARTVGRYLVRCATAAG